MKPEKIKTQDATDADDEIDVLDLLIVMARHKRLVIGLPIVTGVVALAISLIVPPIYTSTAKIMPPQQQGSGIAAAMLGQLGGLAGAAGSLAGLKSPADLYVGMLKSRTVADNLIMRFKLSERYEEDTIDRTREKLARLSDISAGKQDGLIAINVEDEDPNFAAELANAYVNELTTLTQQLALSDASLRRVFFENQLKDAKNQLAEAEVALRMTQEKTGMIQPEGQVQAIISNIAQLKGTIAAKEVQIKGMRSFAAAQNPDLLRAQEELKGLQAQLYKLEASQGRKEGDFMVPSGLLPEVGVEYIRRLRDMKYYEALFETLAKQYEFARLEEAKDAATIQFLDKAVPAEEKTRPRRALITVAGGLLGAVLGVVLAFVREAYLRSRRNAESSSRWNELSKAWRHASKRTTPHDTQ